MNEKQNSREKIDSREHQVKRKGHNSNRNILSTKTKKESVRGKSVLKVSKREIEEEIPAEMLRVCNSLKAVCVRIAKLEKEKQKLLYIILKDVPKLKRFK